MTTSEIDQELQIVRDEISNLKKRQHELLYTNECGASPDSPSIIGVRNQLEEKYNREAILSSQRFDSIFKAGSHHHQSTELVV